MLSMSLKDGGSNKVMHTLEVRQNQVEYAGIFTRPAVSLWGEGKTLLDGLLRAFEGYHSGLSSFRTLG